MIQQAALLDLVLTIRNNDLEPCNNLGLFLLDLSQS